MTNYLRICLYEPYREDNIIADYTIVCNPGDRKLLINVAGTGYDLRIDNTTPGPAGPATATGKVTIMSPVELKE